MDIFFNELSLVPASDDNQARRWLTDLAELGRLLKELIESLEEDSFAFRRREDFAQQQITDTQTVFEFLQSMSDFSDPVYIFLLGIFDSPYITEDDPQKTDYDVMSVTIDGKDHEITGIAAAYLKQSLAISLDSDKKWDTCRLTVQINRMNEQAEIISEQKSVKHAAKKHHVIPNHR
ncbi:MAG: hypothetical protein AB7S75_14905 [Desulfococcaceae bacterium]